MARGRPTRQSIYDRLEEAIVDLRTRLGGLPNPVEAEDIWDDLVAVADCRMLGHAPKILWCAREIEGRVAESAL